MFALAPVFAFFAVMAAATCEEVPQSTVSMQVISPAEMDNLLKLHPNGQLLSVEVSNNPKLGKVLSQPNHQLIYRLGSRIVGDQLVASDSGYNSWATPQNAHLNLYYPTSGVGAVISYLEITVSQSSTIGRAILLSGGIGQRSINVVVEANNTYWLGYSAVIYGRW